MVVFRTPKNFLLKIAFKEVDAYTSLITWDELTWAVRKVLGVEASLSQARKLLKFPNLKLLQLFASMTAASS
jgi:hypothetical protein